MRGALLIPFKARKWLHLSPFIYKYRHSHKVWHFACCLVPFKTTSLCKTVTLDHKVSINHTLNASKYQKRIKCSGRIERELTLRLREEEANSGMTSRPSRIWKNRLRRTVKVIDMEKSDLESIITLIWSLISDWRGGLVRISHSKRTEWTITVQLGATWHLQKSSVKSTTEANCGFYVSALLHITQTRRKFIYIFS